MGASRMARGDYQPRVTATTRPDGVGSSEMSRYDRGMNAPTSKTRFDPLSTITPLPALARLLDGWWMWTGAALLLIFGVKLYLIGVLGDPLPYWDQWDAEAAKLFVPYLEGRLRLDDLLSSHNEHRILLTRLLALGVLEVAGNWNVILEMIIGACLHVAFLAQLIWVLRRASLPLMPGMLAALLLLLFAIPADMENTLAGFQSQFYLLTIFSVASIVLLVEAPLLGVRWWLGVIFAVMSYFCMAAGALTAVAAGGIIAVQILLRSRPAGLAVGAIAILGAIALVMLRYTAHPSYHVELQAKSVLQFILAFGHSAGWPLPGTVISPLVINAPVIVLAVLSWRRRYPVGHPAWRVLALMAWVGLQCASLAYGRAVGPTGSRYVDVLALTVVLNFAALLMLLANLDGIRAWVPNWRAAATVWLAVTAGAIVLDAARTIPRQVMADPAAVLARTEHVVEFIRSGDPAVLRQPFLHIPYPEPGLLAATLSTPEVRGVLPDRYGVPAAEREAVRQRLALKGGLGIEVGRPKRVATILGSLMMALATGLFVALHAWRWRRPV